MNIQKESDLFLYCNFNSNIKRFILFLIDIMYMTTQNIFGISYASRKFANRCEIITSQATASEMFDTFKCYREPDIDEDFIKTHSKIWSNSRGGGWWIWKPYIIYKKLLEMTDNDILVYIDSGCTINITDNSKQRFDKYIEMVNSHDQGFLRFKLTHPEKNFTNKYTIDYFSKKFDVNMEPFINTTQFIGGILIMKKTKFVMDFYENVMAILNDDELLFTDKYNVKEGHRHDQSIQSLLYKVMGGTLFLNDETFGKSPNVPFWATRTTN
jgi:hypothetical protein